VVSPDQQPVLFVEVMVPRIVLPTEPAIAGNTDEEMEQVRIIPLNPSPSPDLSTAQSQQGEVSTYTTHTGPFHLFHIRNVPALGQALLLQILRPQKSNRQTRKGSHPLTVTDELAFTLEVSHSASAYTATPLELIPGLNQVTIVLSEEGIPASYSIDGAES